MNLRLLAAACLSPLLLTGCSSMVTTAAPETATGMALQGEAHGGSQAIVGARVYLLAANSTGYPTAASNLSISLLTTGTPNGTTDPNLPPAAKYVTTGSYGQFTIAGDYTCAIGQQVYLLVLGGNPGAAGASNANIGLMSVLGSCPTSAPFNFATTVPYLYVNEVTTVAAAYAMAGYAYDATHISSSGTALAHTGIVNAFANFGQLVDVATGIARSTTPNGYGTVLNTKINTLANILASCVNSRGTTGSNTSAQNCSTLFNNAKSSGTSGVTPTETATAAINMAHFPGANVGNLYALQAGVGSPFAGLSSAPNDFTMPITFGGFQFPGFLAIDASGNAWVIDEGAASNAKITMLSNLGAPTTPNITGLSTPQWDGLDSSGNLWISDLDNLIGKYVPGSASLTIYSPTGLDSPGFGAIDPVGDIWFTNQGYGTGTSTVSRIRPNGANDTNSPFAVGIASSDQAAGVAIDASGHGWVSTSGGSVVRFSSTGMNVATLTDGSSYQPYGIALDSSGNLWTSNPNFSNVEKFTGAAGTPAQYTGGGISSNVPLAIALDGAGNAWFSNVQNLNAGADPIMELNNIGNPLSPSTGYDLTQVGRNYCIAIDGSGDVWVAQLNNGAVREYIGSATPVVTPIQANLLPPYLAPASRP